MVSSAPGDMEETLKNMEAEVIDSELTFFSFILRGSKCSLATSSVANASCLIETFVFMCLFFHLSEAKHHSHSCLTQTHSQIAF